MSQRSVGVVETTVLRRDGLGSFHVAWQEALWR